jgi:hypothetical protein
MISGATQHITVHRRTADGLPSTGKVTADFTILATVNGAATAVTLTVTEKSTVGDGRAYDVAFTAPAALGQFSARIVPASGTDVVFPDLLEDDITAYSIDSVGGLVATTGAIAVSPVTGRTTLSVYHGDSITAVAKIPEGALTALGATSLADITTLASGIKLTSADSDDAAVATPTVTIVTDTVGARVLRAQLTTFPAALAVPDGGQRSVSARLDIRATKGSVTLIIAVIDITVYWRVL